MSEKMKHTPEPWYATSIAGYEGNYCADVRSRHEKPYGAIDCHVATVASSRLPEIISADAARIVSCVNALAGVENPEEFRKRFDEALKLLLECSDKLCFVETGDEEMECSMLVSRARAAIKAARGE